MWEEPTKFEAGVLDGMRRRKPAKCQNLSLCVPQLWKKMSNCSICLSSCLSFQDRRISQTVSQNKPSMSASVKNSVTATRKLINIPVPLIYSSKSIAYIKGQMRWGDSRRQKMSLIAQEKWHKRNSCSKAWKNAKCLWIW